MVLKFTFWAFVLLVCYSPIIGIFMPRTHFGPGIPDIGPVRLFSYLLIIFFLVEVATKKVVLRFNIWLTIILTFFFVVIFSVYWSPTYTYSHDVIQGIFQSIFLPLVIAFISINLLTSTIIIEKYFKHLSISALILALISITQYFLGISSVESGIRTAATFNNPNALAIFLVAIIPTIIYLIDKRRIAGYVGWIIVFIVFSGIVTTVSRKGISTAFLAFFLFVLLKKDWKKLLVLSIMAFLVCAVIILNQNMHKRFEKQFVERTVQGKLAMAQAGLDMFKQHPVLGLGYKGYYENFGKYFPYSWKRKYDAHNEYVTALANYGLVGFIPFISIFVYPLIIALKKLKQGNESSDMAIIGLSVIIPFMISIAFAGTAFYQQVLTTIFYVNTGIIFSRLDDTQQ